MTAIQIALLVVLLVFVILSFLNLVKQTWINVLVLLLFLLVFFGDKVHAQPTPKPETEKPVDSIPVIATRDIQTFYLYLRDNVSVANYEKLTPDKVLQVFYEWIVQEWNRKKKK